MGNCEYCGARTPASAARCDSCSAAVSTPARLGAQLPFGLSSWREWSPATWVLIAVGGLMVAPMALSIALMLVMIVLSLLWSQPLIAVLVVVTAGVWAAPRRARPAGRGRQN